MSNCNCSARKTLGVPLGSLTHEQHCSFLQLSNSKIDPVVEANVAMLRRRAEVGIKKYGVTLADAGLDLRAWLVHALEETLDKANYLQAAIREIDRTKGDGK